MTFKFSQDGYSEEAAVTGEFTGEDLNMDGVLSFDDGELSAFTASFSGNSLVDGFSLTLDDIAGFAFDLDGSNILGDGFDEGIITTSFFGSDPGAPGYVTGRGELGSFACSLFACGAVTADGTPDFTSGFVTTSEVDVPISPVPVPNSVWFMLSALVGLGVVHRARRPGAARSA
ncbi:MAG: hypothetical protein AAF360_00575 [Pseudomonadota bacterium]